MGRGGTKLLSLETAGQSETGLWDRLEAFQSISADVAGAGDLSQVADHALQLAIELTGASVAFVGLVDESGKRQQVYTRSADASRSVSGDDIDRLFAAATSDNSSPGGAARLPEPGLSSYVGLPLKAGGRFTGILGVAGGSVYTVVQRRALSILANQVAATVEIFRLQQRRQELVEALVNVRADLDRSEKQRVLNEERAKSALKIERAHELAVKALVAVSTHARTGATFASFYRGLTESVAELVGAEKVLFWQLNQNRTLTPIAGAFGIDDVFLTRLYPAPAEPFGGDLTSQVVYEDFTFRASTSNDKEGSPGRAVLDVLGVSSAISVPWRAGDQRLGLVAAYDSRRREGFSMEDAWVLQMAGLAAGLVWQLKLAETDLTSTINRLQKVDEARHLLLKNMSTAVDKARRRFADELHDDALQKLTAAEIHLQRVDNPSSPVGDARRLLDQAELALRKLLFEVRPPALEVPGGFEETIRDRVSMMHTMTGIESEIELSLPDDHPYEIKSIVFRQVSEALTNVEKHAAASRVRVTVKAREGGIHGEVSDDGRGFVVGERDHLPGHLGLLALRERALLAGGWCDVTSEPGAGTKVEFWVPSSQ
ncbi:MAG TPA: GAF domain-containing protein [Candidatus Dormibacteraeota bacterium]|nr:GAF domain-containing protein [Candidatus Dormibacteraeota bacterium]